MATKHSLPIIEWSNRNPRWRLNIWDYPHKDSWIRHNIRRVEFSQARNCEWWYKVYTMKQYGPRQYLQETPWLPVPATDFELPEKAKLQRETAILPKMTAEEWWAKERRKRDEDKEFDEHREG